MELADLELERIVKNLADIISGYYVNNIFSVDGNTVLLRLGHPVKPPERLILSAGRGLWRTDVDLQQETLTSFVRNLRREIPRLRVEGISHPRGERIARIDFSGEFKRSLIGEFFGEGNMILTDGEGRILSLLRPLKVRHRELRPGVTYALPPTRARCAEDITREDLEPLQSSDLPVSRWVGRNLSLPRKYVHEILGRSHIPPDAVGSQLTPEDLDRLYGTVRLTVQMITDPTAIPFLLTKNGEMVEFTAFPIQNTEGLLAEQAPTLLDAIDRAFTQEILDLRRDQGVEPIRRKLEELRHSYGDQQSSITELLRTAGLLRKYAEKLMEQSEDLAATLKAPMMRESEREVQIQEMGGGRFRLGVGAATVEFEEGASAPHLASKLFDEAKGLEQKAESAAAAGATLSQEIWRLEDRIATRGEEELEEIRRPVRKKMWFERYRWFRTSGGLLAIGGRDAASNSAIIRKHLEERDTVFHTDIVGSPFFVLKEGIAADALSIQEVAQATASFSRAWSSGMSVADAYWVSPDQVKLAAPSGMYLPRGSFLIEGEKHLMKGVPLVAAVGVTFLESEPMVFGGPPTAVENQSYAFFALVPERVKATDTAKQLKSGLVSLAQGPDAEVLKRVNVDEFLRALPPGGGRVVRRAYGKQKR